MASVIFHGSAVKTLKDILEFGINENVKIITGDSDDPTVVAKDAPAGSLYFRQGTSEVYQKGDAGASTNWGRTLTTADSVLTGAGSSTDNAVARFDGTSGDAIQNSGVVIDDTNNLSGVGNISLSGTVDGRDVSTDGSTLDSHLDGGASKHDATEIDYERADGSKKNIAAGSDEVESALTNLDDAIGALSGSPTNYVATNAAIVADHLAGIDTKLGSIEAAQAGQEWQDSVIDKDLTAPPGTPSTGDRYLIGLDTTAGIAAGAWATHDGEIAEWDGAAWVFTVPTTGTFVSADDETTVLYLFGGTTWTAMSFEATTASTGLTKVGADIRLDSSSAGDGLGFAAGVLSVNTDDVGIEKVGDTLQLKDGGIVDAKVNAAAAIAHTKMAALTASRAMTTDVSGFATASAVTSTELGYLSGVTSAIQTQIDGKQNDVITTQGDIVIGDAGNEESRLAIGTVDTLLKSNGTTLAYGKIIDANIDAAAAIALSKLAALTADRALASNGSGIISTSTTTATELGYVSGVTSSIQTQLNTKIETITDIVSVAVNTNTVNKKAYLVDSSAGTFTMTLPAPAAGAFVRIKDSGLNASQNNITVSPNAAESIEGVAGNFTINSDGQHATFASDGTNWFVF